MNLRVCWLGAAVLCPSHVPSQTSALASGPVNHLLVFSVARRPLNEVRLKTREAG